MEAETANIEKKIPRFIATNNFLVLILDKEIKDNLKNGILAITNNILSNPIYIFFTL